jgi:hypothetical protein
MAKDLEPRLVSVSVAAIVKLELPLDVTVPLKTPPLVRLSPPGSLPDRTVNV